MLCVPRCGFTIEKRKRIIDNSCAESEQHAEPTADIELKLDEADFAAGINEERYTTDEVFGRAKQHIHE